MERYPGVISETDNVRSLIIRASLALMPATMPVRLGPALPSTRLIPHLRVFADAQDDNARRTA